ncbi:MAG: class I SAM-dependent rRNA methyltransferase [Pedosphaera sp.]|nr:class I SAM-dependent rRNA methyltransferase [Pedosphaera sp.]
MRKTNPPPANRLRLRLTAAAENCVRGGHPWVFAESVREQNRDGISGELAVIFDRQDKFLAVGFFDPDSPIRVRVLHIGKPLTIDAEFWRARLDAALRRREGLFDERTTGYRLINGESDGWPGLVLDRYDATVVMKIYASAWLPRVEEISALVRARLKLERVVLRTSRNIQVRVVSQKMPPHPGPLPLGGGEGESFSAAGEGGAIVFGERLREPAVFAESGLRFEADVLRGQKTGFFLDQRENRREVELLAHGRTVLNAFSFSGGFSLYAARGGAKSVADLDISSHALAAAQRNFQLNQKNPKIAQCRREAVQADAFAWLAANAERKFDLIVLDPPSLAKRETERVGAIRAYGKLAADGIKHLSPGGILVACSCSAHVGAEEFFGAMRSAAGKSGRKFEELRTTRHAPDHPATFKEAEYLKAIYLRA